MKRSGWNSASGLVAWALVAAGAPASWTGTENASAAEAAPVLHAGDAMPPLVLHDQNGVEVRIDDGVRLLLLTRDMGSGGFVKEALAEGGREALAAAKAVYISDVSGMPSLVLSTFAMPGLRKRPYPVVLDDKGKATAALPWQEGKVSVLTLDGGKVKAVAFLSTTADVKKTLGL